MFDTIHHETFYLDFHGFCPDSPLPLLAPIDGPSVGFMRWAQLESRVDGGEDNAGRVPPLPNQWRSHSDPDSFNSTLPSH